jgi:hypothetical protein
VIGLYQMSWAIRRVVRNLHPPIPYWKSSDLQPSKYTVTNVRLRRRLRGKRVGPWIVVTCECDDELMNSS